MSVLYIGFMVSICGVRYVCPIYRIHGVYLWRSGTSVLCIGCTVTKVNTELNCKYENSLSAVTKC